MLEHFDEATNNFFKENIAYLISGVGWGNIHKFAKDYLPASADFAYNSAWMPNSGILYLLAGSGVIGAILFFQFFRKVLSWPNLIKNHNSQEKYLKQIVIFALLTFIVRNNEILFFLTGVYILYKSSYLKQEQLKNRGENEH